MCRLIVLSALTILASFSQAEPEKTGEEVCGRYGRWLADEDRKNISTNVVAQPGKTPSMVLITEQLTYSIGYAYGILIHPQAVLFHSRDIKGFNMGSVRVVAGYGNSIQKRRPSGVIAEVYGKYQRVENPIAIMKLSSPFELSENVGISCIPHSYEMFNDLHSFTTEWRGFTPTNPTEGFDTVRALNISYNNCPDEEDMIYDTVGDPYEKAGHICVGLQVNPKNECRYFHSKASLISQLVDDPSRYALIGIDEVTFRCVNGDSLLLYDFVDIVHFRDWIDRKLSENGMKMSVC